MATNTDTKINNVSTKIEVNGRTIYAFQTRSDCYSLRTKNAENKIVEIARLSKKPQAKMHNSYSPKEKDSNKYKYRVTYSTLEAELFDLYVKWFGFYCLTWTKNIIVLDKSELPFVEREVRMFLYHLNCKQEEIQRSAEPRIIFKELIKDIQYKYNKEVDYKFKEYKQNDQTKVTGVWRLEQEYNTLINKVNQKSEY